VPYGLSILAYHDPHAEVKGLDQIPRADWPHVPTVHLAFEVMLALGTWMALLGLWVVGSTVRKRDLFTNRRLLLAITLSGPLGILAIEAGWVVTEVGRQPWIIQGILRTADAVTPMPHLIVPFTLFTLLYLLLGVVVGWMLYQQILGSPTSPRDAVSR
jgi:cytochrome d ubiquinol oxidase subunit I